MRVDVEGHSFEVVVKGDYFELYGKMVTDSRDSVGYRGPLRKFDDLSDDIKEAKVKNPGLSLMWRKCKTVLKIPSRCNGHVWNAAMKIERLLRLRNCALGCASLGH